MAVRKPTHSPEMVRAMAARYPNERNDVLAADFGIEVAAVKWLAHKHKWRKSKKLRSDLGRQFCQQKEDPDKEIMEEMVGAERRKIHSGLLLVRGNKMVHLSPRK